MSKTFYTEQDIENLARQGVQSLTVTDDVVLTDLAFEKAERLGVQLVRPHAAAPSAPVRPYISDIPRPASAPAGQAPASREDLHQRVRAAVIGRLGGELDSNLLDTIIRRVLDNIATGD